MLVLQVEGALWLGLCVLWACGHDTFLCRSFVRSSFEPMWRQIRLDALQSFRHHPSGWMFSRCSISAPVPENLHDVMQKLSSYCPPEWLLLSAEVQLSRGLNSLKGISICVREKKKMCFVQSLIW